MQSSTGPGIGLSPRSQCATVFGHTPRSFASCDWLNLSRRRICLNLFPVMATVYQRYRAGVNSKLGDNGVDVLHAEGAVVAHLLVWNLTRPRLCSKPAFRYV